MFCHQVFYYLGELNDSLSYALGAGPLFDVSEDSDYVHTLLGEKLLLIIPLKLCHIYFTFSHFHLDESGHLIVFLIFNMWF